MSAVIKSADADGAGRVRPLGIEPTAPTPSSEALALAAAESRLTAALERIAALEAEAVRERAEVDAAIAQAREAGVAEGRRTADNRSQAMLTAVETATRSAVTSFQARLEELEAAAGGLAGLAIERIAGEPGVRSDLITGAVRRTLADAATGAVVRIEVSAADFPDPTALAGIPAGAEVVALDQPSGGCRIVLRLGEIDLGLDGQVARLRALLETAA